MTFKISACTDIGSRYENQDNFLIDDQVAWVQEDCRKIAYVNADARMHLAAVADGVGGSSNGKLASMTVLDQIFMTLKSQQETETLEKLANRLLDDANNTIISANRTFRMRIATTLSFVLWNQKGFIACNIGDSPIYLLRNRKLHLLSYAQVSPFNIHAITGYCGREDITGSAMSYKILVENWEPGDKILICSDGASNELSDPLIENALNSENPLVSIWQNLPKPTDDNCTILVIEMEE